MEDEDEDEIEGLLCEVVDDDGEDEDDVVE